MKRCRTIGAVFVAVVAFFSLVFPRIPSTSALTTAETSSKSKTVVFQVLQRQTILADGSSDNADFTVFIGDQAPVIKNAYLEVQGVTNATGSQTITVDIKESGVGSFPTVRSRSFAIDSSSKNNPFLIRYHGDEGTGNGLTAYLAGLITAAGTYVYSVKIDASGADVALLKANLVLTYEYAPPSTGGTVPNSVTASFFAAQSQSVIITPGTLSATFKVFVAEPNPVVKNAFLLVQGVTNATGSQTITVDIKQPADSFPTARAQTFTVDSTGKDSRFAIRYHGNDGTGNGLTAYLAGIITAPTEYTFDVKIDTNGADVSLLGARLVVNYQFSQSGGGFPAVGNVVSPTLDTGAVNGASYNGILWKGSAPVGTKVRLQLAASDSSTGPFSFVGGSTCTASDYYEPAADAPAEVKCFSALYNKRYFRYKVILCSGTDCSTSGSETPRVDDVIVNWSP
ncbi:MAG: hypothetical protein AAB692_01385 [Patescibacteria group bacterium]